LLHSQYPTKRRVVHVDFYDIFSLLYPVASHETQALHYVSRQPETVWIK
jgi:hypothetical protein